MKKHIVTFAFLLLSFSVLTVFIVFAPQSGTADSNAPLTSGTLHSAGGASDTKFIPDCTSDERNTRGNTLSNLKDEGKLARQGNWLYYSLDGPLRKIPIGGDAEDMVFISDKSLSYINVVGNWIYGREGSTIWQIKTDGSEVYPVADNATDGSEVYVIDAAYDTEGRESQSAILVYMSEKQVDSKNFRYHVEVMDIKVTPALSPEPLVTQRLAYAAAARYPLMLTPDNCIVYSNSYTPGTNGTYHSSTYSLARVQSFEILSSDFDWNTYYVDDVTENIYYISGDIVQSDAYETLFTLPDGWGFTSNGRSAYDGKIYAGICKRGYGYGYGAELQTAVICINPDTGGYYKINDDDLSNYFSSMYIVGDGYIYYSIIHAPDVGPYRTEWYRCRTDGNNWEKLEHRFGLEPKYSS